MTRSVDKLKGYVRLNVSKLIDAEWNGTDIGVVI